MSADRDDIATRVMLTVLGAHVALVQETRWDEFHAPDAAGLALMSYMIADAMMSESLRTPVDRA